MPPECRRSLPPRPAGRIQHPASSMLPRTRERRLSRSGHSGTSVAPPATRDTCLRHASVQPWHALSPSPSSGTQDFRILSDERAEQLRAKVRGRVNPNPHPNPNPNPKPHPHPHPNPYPYPNPNPYPNQAGQVSEDFATSQVGNIAAAGALLAPRIGSLAKSSWTWFSKGFVAEDGDATQAADNQAGTSSATPAAAAPTAAAAAAAAASSAAAAAAAGAPAAAPAAAAPAGATTAMAAQQARMQRMAEKAAEARINAG